MPETLFGAWPFIAVFTILALMAHANWTIHKRACAATRNEKEFSILEASLFDPDSSDDTSRFFSGEAKLRSFSTIHFPASSGDGRFAENLAVAIDEALKIDEIGFVVRCYPYDGGIGIDLQMEDFIKGIDTVRNVLIQHDAPDQTFIECEAGELPLMG